MKSDGFTGLLRPELFFGVYEKRAAQEHPLWLCSRMKSVRFGLQPSFKAAARFAENNLLRFAPQWMTKTRPLGMER